MWTVDGLTSAMARVGRVDALVLLWDAWTFGRVPAQVMTAVIGPAWSTAEYPQMTLPAGDWLAMFALAGYTVDGVPVERPVAPLVLWRGSHKARRRRWSWTVDRAVAERFAGLGSRETGTVWTAVVPPEALLAHLTDRDESEYVVNTRGLKIQPA